MKKICFRDLREDEIDVRVAMCKENGCSLLLYKDARCDMNILDETVGAENWTNRFYAEKGILFCSVGINTNYQYDEDDVDERWVTKDDAGVESNTEAEKGNASDARKRAGFAWGIGRELYTAPFIWITAKDKQGEPNYTAVARQNGTYSTNDKFIVEKIRIENKKITALSILNKTKGKRVFVWQEPKKENK